MEFRKFTQIEKIENAFHKLKMLRKIDEVKNIHFRSKIKLHGCNIGVRIFQGKTFFQKRSEDISSTRDLYDFSKFAETVKWKTDRDAIIYGEWAGPGIHNSNDAICNIQTRCFFVFSVFFTVSDKDPEKKPIEYMVVEPDLIQDYLPEDSRIMVIPWFENVKHSKEGGDKDKIAIFTHMNKQIQEIEQIDPFVLKTFNVSGPGEGLVVMPCNDAGIVECTIFSSLVFKMKTDSHSVISSKEPPKDIDGFCEMFFNDIRCNQMIFEHMNRSVTERDKKKFIKHILADIKKESKLEMEIAKLKWKFVERPLNKRANAWFDQYLKGMK